MPYHFSRQQKKSTIFKTDIMQKHSFFFSDLCHLIFSDQYSLAKSLDNKCDKIRDIAKRYKTLQPDVRSME